MHREGAMCVAEERVEAMVCAICQEAVWNPVQLQCDHIFCHTCVVSWRDRCWRNGRELSCPTCRKHHPEPTPLKVNSVLAAVFNVMREAPVTPAEAASPPPPYPWRRLPSTEWMRVHMYNIIRPIALHTFKRCTERVCVEMEGILYTDASSISAYMDIASLRTRVHAAYRDVTGPKQRRADCHQRLRLSRDAPVATVTTPIVTPDAPDAPDATMEGANPA
jgi:hypothetical protein